MTNEEVVEYIWHFRVEDKMPWSFCAGIINQDQGTKYTGDYVKKKFIQYFKEKCGISPYDFCPECGEELLPRKSIYGYFIGCSAYPRCKFIATSKKPYKSKAPLA